LDVYVSLSKHAPNYVLFLGIITFLITLTKKNFLYR
jgi:hypothetical protein